MALILNINKKQKNKNCTLWCTNFEKSLQKCTKFLKKCTNQKKINII